MMVTRKQTAIVGLKVRLREPLRKRLEVAAKQRGVSLNAELVSRLEQSFQAGDLMEMVRRQLQDYLRLLVSAQSGASEQRSRRDWSEIFERAIAPSEDDREPSDRSKGKQAFQRVVTRQPGEKIK